jgi:ABC-2 type transport system permease protein
MGKLWAVIKREYLERVRTRWFLFSTILAPVLFGVLIFLPLYFAQRTVPSVDVARIVIIDATGAGLGRLVATELNGGIMGDTSRTRVVETTAAAIPAAERGGSGEVRGFFAVGIAFLLYIAIFLYGQNVLRGVMEEKQTRVAEVVVSSVPATQLMAGKVIGVGAAGVTQLVLSVGASYATYRFRAPMLARFGLPQIPYDVPHIALGTALLLLLFFLLGYLFYAALFAAIGAMVSSETEAQQVQLPVAMLLVTSAIFIQPVMFAPESGTAVSLSLLPFSAPIIMPLRLSLIDVPPSQIALSIVSLTAGCFIAVWLAARIYRTGLLMYGKRPSLGEIARWVRQAG